MCWGGEEALAIADLDDIGVTDLPIRLAWHNFEKIPVWTNWRGWDVTQLLPSHLVLIDLVVRPIDLDPESLFLVLLWVPACHEVIPFFAIDTMIPPHHST